MAVVFTLNVLELTNLILNVTEVAPVRSTGSPFVSVIVSVIGGFRSPTVQVGCSLIGLVRVARRTTRQECLRVRRLPGCLRLLLR